MALFFYLFPPKFLEYDLKSYLALGVFRLYSIPISENVNPFPGIFSRGLPATYTQSRRVSSSDYRIDSSTGPSIKTPGDPLLRPGDENKPVK